MMAALISANPVLRGAMIASDHDECVTPRDARQPIKLSVAS
jgi:hypothetical protein